MGHYTKYVIGDFCWEFKYHVPHFLLFLFDEEDFVYKEMGDDTEDLDVDNNNLVLILLYKFARRLNEKFIYLNLFYFQY